MQEWIGEFPEALIRVANTRNFDITFYGLPLDWDDFSYVFREAQEQGILGKAKLRFTQGKTMEDEVMAQKIADVFQDLRDGPVADFRSPELLEAVEKLQNKMFPVNVVATMSSGKSTLINALLGQKLLPAKNEPCTAVITEIRDNDAPAFSASVYNQKNQFVEDIALLDAETMKRLNGDKNVFRIAAQGNIPFLDAKSMALVLVDTPGPNNSQNQAHRRTTYRILSADKKNMVLYVLNGAQLSTNDDHNLLTYVAEQMRKGSKQVRDRFLFVINRMDDFDPEEESIEDAIKQAVAYLNKHGIENPQIFPCSAITALDISTVLADIDLSERIPKALKKSNTRMETLNDYEELHLERYASLPPTAKKEIEDRLAVAEKDGDVRTQALIHSGVCSLETGIRAYVKKYAQKEKVKDVIDTFQSVLDENEVFTKAKKQIAEDKKTAEAYAERAQAIRAYLNDGKVAQQFRDKIQAFDPMRKIRKAADDLAYECAQEVTKIFQVYPAVLKSRSDAERLVMSFVKLRQDALARMSVELESVVNRELVETSKKLLQEYQEKLAVLDKEASHGNEGLDLHTADLVKSALQTMRSDADNWQSDQFATETIDALGSVTIENKTYYEKVGEEEEQIIVGQHKEKIGTRKIFAGTHKEKVGTRTVKNPNKSWWQFWKSSTIEETVYQIVNDFKEEDVYENVNDYKTVTRDFFEKRTKRIEHFSANLDDIQVRLVAAAREDTDDGLEEALKYSAQLINDLKTQFSAMFDQLDRHIQKKYEELEKAAKGQEESRTAMEKAQKILDWLKANQKEMYDIVEI